MKLTKWIVTVLYLVIGIFMYLGFAHAFGYGVVLVFGALCIYIAIKVMPLEYPWSRTERIVLDWFEVGLLLVLAGILVKDLIVHMF